MSFYSRARFNLSKTKNLLGLIAKKRVDIFMYHAVVGAPLDLYDWCFVHESQFRQQLETISSKYDVVSLSKAVDRLNDKNRYQKPMAVITFDDGFQNNYDVVFPVLCELDIPATIFVVTGLVDSNDTLWYCRLHQALINTDEPILNWSDSVFDLSSKQSKIKASIKIQEKLKRYPQHKLMSELRGIISKLGDDAARSIDLESPYRMLAGKAIKEMLTTGLIQFGAHTVSHAILSQLSIEQQKREIVRSLEYVRGLTGEPCRYFAYSNGRKQDYDPESIQILIDNGVIAAVTSIEGSNYPKTPMMELKRYGIGANLAHSKFEQLIT